MTQRMTTGQENRFFMLAPHCLSISTLSLRFKSQSTKTRLANQDGSSFVGRTYRTGIQCLMAERPKNLTETAFRNHIPVTRR